jgi:ligand-binding SRPBCC domain-containing protein
LPLKWRTRIERWIPGVAFVDSQERGPYRAWWHEHRFVERDGKTVMEDTVHYAPPLGPLGAIANKLIVERMLRRIFGYRRSAIRLRFSSRA